MGEQGGVRRQKQGCKEKTKIDERWQIKKTNGQRVWKDGEANKAEKKGERRKEEGRKTYVCCVVIFRKLTSIHLNTNKTENTNTFNSKIKKI